VATNSARENSVKQLCEFYNVVSGVALALAITEVIDVNAPTIPVHTELILNFLTFLVIVIPFHQGAVRHLFATYVENGGSCAFRKSYPNVMVVQPRQDWDAYNDPGPLHCPT
jgi:hypothetical protein